MSRAANNRDGPVSQSNGGIAREFCEFGGAPQDLGRAYGTTHALRIRHVLSQLVRKTDKRASWTPGQPVIDVPAGDPGFRRWVRRQEQHLARQWPWLLEEIAGVAEGAGVPYEDTLLLNLRAHQYHYYGAPAQAFAHGCSSLAVRLADGSVANAGAVDDSAEFYCGLTVFEPVQGYAVATWPIAGTVGCTRALNSAGLAVGIASLCLPGLERRDGYLSQDLALRLLAQTCATVDEVRQFCREQPFDQNLVCSDAFGGVFCAHQTGAGCFELSQQTLFALTNHVTDPEIGAQLEGMGVIALPHFVHSTERREHMLRFLEEREGNLSAHEVRRFVSACDESEPGSIAHAATYVQTYVNPENEPGILWATYPSADSPFEWRRIPLWKET
jgi:hypothetical protein